MSEPTSTTCTQLSDVMGISHDSVNRFLSRESYDPKDLFNESMALIDPQHVILSVDDSVLDKPYSQHRRWLTISGQASTIAPLRD